MKGDPYHIKYPGLPVTVPARVPGNLQPGDYILQLYKLLTTFHPELKLTSWWRPTGTHKSGAATDWAIPAWADLPREERKALYDALAAQIMASKALLHLDPSMTIQARSERGHIHIATVY